MKFIRTAIEDVVICEPTIHGDKRGYFLESFRQDELEAFLGMSVDFCQDNESKSDKGVLRGLHYQLVPHAQTKLVRVISGKILDVAVDLRKGSPTFGRHVSVELCDVKKRQLFVPRGFAHGFLVLSDIAIVAYKVDNYYNADLDRGISYNDKDLAIDWQFDVKQLNLSAKDQKLPLLSDSTDLFRYGENYYD